MSSSMGARSTGRPPRVYSDSELSGISKATARPSCASTQGTSGVPTVAAARPRSALLSNEENAGASSPRVLLAGFSNRISATAPTGARSFTRDSCTARRAHASTVTPSQIVRLPGDNEMHRPGDQHYFADSGLPSYEESAAAFLAQRVLTERASSFHRWARVADCHKVPAAPSTELPRLMAPREAVAKVKVNRVAGRGRHRLGAFRCRPAVATFSLFRLRRGRREG